MMFEQSLTEGLLTYGYVAKAEKVNLEIILPKGLTGIVNATNISRAYTSYLKSLVNNGDRSFSQMDDHTLSDVFPEGSLIVCKIISMTQGIFNLSLSPEDINSNIGQAQIKNDMIIVGSVKSVEDHGYLIDIGVKSVYAFLSNANASKYNNGEPIQVGQQLHCLIVSVTNASKNVIRTVTLTANPFKIATQMIKKPLRLPISFICPGLQAEATIVKDEVSHLKAKFLSYEAVIPKCYCNPDEQGHKLNSVVRATVLQHHPETNVIILTLKVTCNSVVSELFPDMSKGQITKGVVKYINFKSEVYLLLPNRLWGFAHLPNLPGQKRSSVLETYQVDSKHSCRVMRFLPLENLVEVSLNWKPNKFEYLGLKDTLPGGLLKTKLPEIRKELKSIKNANIAEHQVEETKISEERKDEESIENANVDEHQVEKIKKSRKVVKKLVKTPKMDKVGKVSRGTIVKKLNKSFKVCLVSSGKTAVLPMRHLSDFEDHREMLWNIYNAGDMLDVVIFKHLNKTTICSHKHSLIAVARNETFVHTFDDIHVGQILTGIVKTIVDYGIFVEYPGGLVSLAVTKDISVDLHIDLHKNFKEGMTVSTRVCQINKKKHQFRVSLKLKITDMDPDYYLNYFQVYLEEKRIITELLKAKKDASWLFGDLQIGDVCFVTVTEVVKQGVHCVLETGIKGFIAMNQIKGLTVKDNMQVAAVVLDLDLLHGIVQLVASTLVVERVQKVQKNLEEIPKNKRIKSSVMLVRKDYVVVLLKVKGKAKLAYLSPKMHMNDVICWNHYKVNAKQAVQFVQCIDCKYIVKLHKPAKQISLLTKSSQRIRSKLKAARIRDAHVDDVDDDNDDSQVCKAMDMDTNTKPVKQPKLKKKTKAMKRKSEGNVDGGDDGCTGKEPPRKSSLKNKCKLDQNSKSIEVMPPVYFNWDNGTVPAEQNGHVSSDEDIEMSGHTDEENTTNTLLKKKKAARKLEKKQEEERLYEIERQRIIGEKLPETADDFDRLLLNSPNSSMLWLRYMAFHLETAEIDKARSVAERALKTILFREEQEKFNVWIAFLNLENLYGTKENLTAVLQRALQQNQPLKVYQQLVNIYIKSGKIQAARDVYDILLKRFRKEKEIWIHFAIFCYKNSFLEQGRELIEKAVRIIDKKDHVALVSKIAQLEFKYGDVQRGTTIFESIVSNYPRRTDLWSIYIDMAMLQKDKEQIRHLFQRVTNLRHSSRKMKFFYKRYLDFEEKNGDKESTESVREKAKQYVDETV